MTQIPPRVFTTWETGINVRECYQLLKRMKLECSKCSRTFDGEFGFKCHIEKCLKSSVRDRNYLVHMYGNRLLVLQHRLALYCGVTEKADYTKCVLCKSEFENYAELRRHHTYCRTYSAEYSTFMQKTQILFDNLLLSYDALGVIFQKFKNDERMIHYRRVGPAPPPVNFPIVYPIPFNTDRLEEFFSERTQMFYFSLLEFSHDVFIRYLKKREEEVDDCGGIDYLQKDPYVNVSRSEEENGNDTETDYDTEEEDEDEDDDVEVETDDGEEEELDADGKSTSGAESEDEHLSDDDEFEGFEEPMEYEEEEDEEEMHEEIDEDEIIDVVGLDEDEEEIVYQPQPMFEDFEDDDDYIEVVM